MRKYKLLNTIPVVSFEEIPTTEYAGDWDFTGSQNIRRSFLQSRQIYMKNLFNYFAEYQIGLQL